GLLMERQHDPIDEIGQGVDGGKFASQTGEKEEGSIRFGVRWSMFSRHCATPSDTRLPRARPLVPCPSWLGARPIPEGGYHRAVHLLVVRPGAPGQTAR